MPKTKKKEIEKDVREYIDEIIKRYPNAQPKIMKDKVSTEDVWIRVDGIPPKDEDKVLRTAIKLQVKWYLERGVYIFVTVSGTGPL